MLRREPICVGIHVTPHIEEAAHFIARINSDASRTAASNFSIRKAQSGVICIHAAYCHGCAYRHLGIAFRLPAADCATQQRFFPHTTGGSWRV